MLLKIIFFRHVHQPGPKSRNHPVHSLDAIYSSVPALRISVSIFQLIYASFTLYHTKGDQIHRYGYAAFGLTVTPYLFMSFVNLLGSLLTPSYPCVYLIQTNIMIEARRRKDGEFDGVVGVIDDQWVEAPSTKLKSWSFTNKIYHNLLPEIRQILKKLSSCKDQVQQALQEFSSWYEARVEPIWQVFLPFFDVLGVAKAKETDHQLWETKPLDNKELEFTGERLRDEGQPFPKVRIDYSVIERKTMKALARLSIMRDLCIYMGCLPFAIIGSLSRFENGNSTTAQRAWTMIWLVVGILLGPDCFESIGALSNSVASLTAFNLFKIQGIGVVSVFAYGVAPIGGMVVVGQMLMEYDSCVRMC